MNDSDFVVCDTNVLSYMAKSSSHASAYAELLGARRIALSFVARTELLGFEWSPKRRARLDILLHECVHLPQSDSTGNWYVLAARKRGELELKGAVGDNDLWILAAAGEYSVPLMTHDLRQALIARSLGIEVLSVLAVS